MSERFRPTAHRVPADPIAARMRAFDNSGLEPDPMSIDDLRHRGDQRTRRNRLAGAGAAVTALAVAGIVAVTQLGSTPEALPANTSTETAATEPGPTQTGPPEPGPIATGPIETGPMETKPVGPTTPPDGPTSAQTATAERTRQVDVGVATIEIPENWSVDKTMTGFILENPPPEPERYCLRDPDVDSIWCTIEIQVGEQVVGWAGEIWESHQEIGWYHPTDMQPCPAQPSVDATADQSDSYGIDFTKMPPPERDFGPVGDRTAELSTYSARCNGGETFTPRIWWLPQTGLFIADILGNPHTENILRSVEFTD